MPHHQLNALEERHGLGPGTTRLWKEEEHKRMNNDAKISHLKNFLLEQSVRLILYWISVSTMVAQYRQKKKNYLRNDFATYFSFLLKKIFKTVCIWRTNFQLRPSLQNYSASLLCSFVTYFYQYQIIAPSLVTGLCALTLMATALSLFQSGRWTQATKVFRGVNYWQKSFDLGPLHWSNFLLAYCI